MRACFRSSEGGRGGADVGKRQRRYRASSGTSLQEEAGTVRNRVAGKRTVGECRVHVSKRERGGGKREGKIGG